MQNKIVVIISLLQISHYNNWEEERVPFRYINDYGQRYIGEKGVAVDPIIIHDTDELSLASEQSSVGKQNLSGNQSTAYDQSNAGKQTESSKQSIANEQSVAVEQPKARKQGTVVQESNVDVIANIAHGVTLFTTNALLGIAGELCATGE